MHPTMRALVDGSRSTGVLACSSARLAQNILENILAKRAPGVTLRFAQQGLGETPSPTPETGVLRDPPDIIAFTKETRAYEPKYR